MSRQEELPTGGRRGWGDPRAERLSAIRFRGQAAISLTADDDGTHIQILESSQLEG